MRRTIVVLVALAAGCLDGADRLTIGTTTSTQDSGLLEALLPAFAEAASIGVRAVVGGTGETLERARRGDVDVLFTHSPTRERALVADGIAAVREPVMFNRFVVAGPRDDPAGTRHAVTAADAFLRIHGNRSLFFSRGDRSGTHDKEVETWTRAGLDPAAFDPAWYKETGTGQGSTLMVAAEFDAYVLVDEGTLRQFHARSRATNLDALFEGDAALRNQYAVTRLDPARIPSAIDDEGAARFAEWLTSPAGQAAIETFRIGGERAFTPNAHEREA